MNVWRNSINDVQALGIVITQDQIEVLERGGEVLVIQGLPEPGCYVYYGEHKTATDQDGQMILVASILRSYPIDGPALPGIKAESMYELVKSNMNNPDWNYWPSYTGELVEDHIAVPFEWFTGSAASYRVWSGIPLVTCGTEVAHAIVDVCNERIEASPWGLMENFIGYLEEYGKVPEPSPELGPDEQDFIGQEKEMVAEGLWDHDGGWFTGNGMKVPSMEDCLRVVPANVDREEVMYWWNMLVSQSRVGTDITYDSISEKNIHTYLYEEKEYDAWL
jgi:hypothetical protein